MLSIVVHIEMSTQPERLPNHAHSNGCSQDIGSSDIDTEDRKQIND